jgi:acetylornithine deacetylase/succinyl-diaminopimelate desuccinylase
MTASSRSSPEERSRAVSYLGQLIAARSPNPPGDERAAADAVTNQIQDLGLPPPDIFADAPERPNLFIRLGSGSPHLLLNAHLDTMPPGDLDLWASDPYQLDERDGRFYGLGVADMKGAVVALLLATCRVARNPEPEGTLTVVLSADEENGARFGMEWLAAEGLLEADAAVVVEPSSIGPASWEKLFVAGRGSYVYWLVAHGTPGHSGISLPAEQRAGAVFARALTTLIEADLFSGLAHPVDGTRPTVNVATMVEGGMVPFAYPETLRATIDVRAIEGMQEPAVRAELEKVLEVHDLAGRVKIVPARPPVAIGETMRDPALLESALLAWRQTLGTNPELAVLPAGTDSAHLNSVGIPALPTFGPGTLAVAHQPNESLPVDDLYRAIDLFEALIRNYHTRTR